MYATAVGSQHLRTVENRKASSGPKVQFNRQWSFGEGAFCVQGSGLPLWALLQLGPLSIFQAYMNNSRVEETDDE